MLSVLMSWSSSASAVRCSDSYESLMSGVVAIFNPLVVPDPRFVDQHDPISHRSRLDGTQNNKIRLSQVLRMGLSTVSMLFY